MVENDEFRSLVMELNPDSFLCHADSLRSKILNRTATVVEDIQMELLQNNSKISFTTDIWTNSVQKPFMVVTAHYIDSNWNLESVMLDFRHFPGSHTGIKSV